MKKGKSVFLAVKVALVLIIAFFAAFSAERFMTNPDGINGLVRCVSLERNIVVPTDSLGYFFCVTDEEGNLLPAGGPPQIQMETPVETPLVSLRLSFNAPLQESMAFTMYYTSYEKDFTPDRMVQAFCEAGSTEVMFYVDSNFPVNRIRIDGDLESEIGFSVAAVTLNCFSVADELIKGFGTPISLERYILYLLFFLFLGLHFLVDVKKMYAFLFRYRWAVAGIVFVALVCLQLHGSSVSYYNDLIQPGQGGDYSNPVLGSYRAIRSDERSVSTPAKLSVQFLDEPYSMVNSILRGTDTFSVSTSKIYWGWGMLSSPTMWGFFFLPFNFAYSFMWFSGPILSFMTALELFYIITKKNALMSTVGATLIVFSAFFQWWGFPRIILGGCGVLVCVYYLIHAKAYWKKILFSLGMAFSAAYYLSYMYPARMVPAAYLFFGIFVWMVVTNWKEIRALNWKSWLIFFGGIVLGLAVIAAFLLEYADYASSILQTVYPGSRISTGGFAFDQLFYYFQSPTFSYTDVQATPYSTFFTFFPIPVILIVYNWIRGKKVDLLSGILMAFSVIMTTYITVGWPEWLARITLMSYSPEYRAVNILEIAQIFILIIALTRYEEVKKMPRPLAAAAGLLTAGLCMWVSQTSAPFVMKDWYLAVGGIALCVFCYGILRAASKRAVRALGVSVICLLLVVGLPVNPLVRGFDCIYSKPLAQEVMSLVEDDPDAKWLTVDDRWTSSFLVSCGAPTINYVNVYPNEELWEILDPEKVYERYWNRYSHFLVYLTEDETSVELLYEDTIILYLNYKDLERIGVSYIVTSVPQSGAAGVELEKIYYENRSYIYRVIY